MAAGLGASFLLLASFAAMIAVRGRNCNTITQTEIFANEAGIAQKEMPSRPIDDAVDKGNEVV